MTFQKKFIGKQADSFAEALSLLKLPLNSNIVTMQQVHGADSVKISQKNVTHMGKNQKSKKTIHLENVDACYTSHPNIFLSVKSADCLPVLISGSGIGTNRPTPFVAAAHAGRKGTEKKIIKNLLKKLEKEFEFCSLLQKNKHELNIWFGPAICKKCYQIDQETDTHYDLISENKKQVLDFFEKNSLDPKKHLNLEVETNCTLHEPNKFHSYRKSGPGVKMNYSFIGIA